MSDLLNIQNLRVHFDTLDGPVEALHSVSLSVKEGEIMGVVGESGCGKSVTSLVTIGLASCNVDEGSITFEDKELIHEVPEVTAKTLSVLKAISSIAGLCLILAMLWFFRDPLVGFLIGATILVFLLIVMFFIFVINILHQWILTNYICEISVKHYLLQNLLFADCGLSIIEAYLLSVNPIIISLLLCHPSF